MWRRERREKYPLPPLQKPRLIPQLGRATTQLAVLTEGKPTNVFVVLAGLRVQLGDGGTRSGVIFTLVHMSPRYGCFTG